MIFDEAQVNNMTAEELAKYVDLGAIKCTVDVMQKLITYYEEGVEILTAREQSTAEEVAAVFKNHCGEDFHSGITDLLFEALDQNKPEMKEIIKLVIRKLEDADQIACNAVDYVNKELIPFITAD